VLHAIPRSTSPDPTTMAPGSVITIVGGPSATASTPVPHKDGADFYGIILVLAAIVVAIVLTRVLFGRRGGSPGAGGSAGR
jgi:hypothetical protein